MKKIKDWPKYFCSSSDLIRINKSILFCVSEETDDQCIFLKNELILLTFKQMLSVGWSRSVIVEVSLMLLKQKKRDKIQS